MRERFVHQCHVLRLPDDPEAEGAALAHWRKELGPRRTRRMSALGLVLTSVLEAHSFEDDPALVYTTTYTETQSLERFIDSFPHASPLLFQMSIHPGGVEQALIARQQSVSEFFPLAGCDGIISQGLKTAFVSSRPRTIWVGGEERGGWLLDVEMASPSTFAWALALDHGPEGAVARVAWTPEGDGDLPDAPGTGAFCEALESRRDLSWKTPGVGVFHWNWS